MINNKLNFTLIFLLLVTTLSSQEKRPTPNDSTQLVKIIQRIKAANIFKKQYHDFRFTAEGLSHEFCHLIDQYPVIGQELFHLYFDPRSVTTIDKNVFFYRNFNCFTSEQRELVKTHLSGVLKSTDPVFHELASLYQLQEFIPILSKNINTNLYQIIILDSKQANLSNLTKTQLQSMATLANLGIDSLENQLIRIVNNIYQFYKTEKEKKSPQANRNFYIFYRQILPNTVGILLSKKSVIETLSLLDHPHYELIAHDVAEIHYGLIYFSTVASDKVENFDLKLLTMTDFEKNIPKIKDILQNDPTIWYDYIRQ